MNYRPIKLQTAFFLATIDLSSRLKIAALVRECIPKYFDVDPLLLPLPPNSPPDFPQIIIQNEQAGWIFQIAGGRFDIVANFPASPAIGNHLDLFQEIQSVSSGLYNVLTNNFGAKANRLGFVVTMVADMENATELLRSKYLNTKEVLGAYETSLFFLHKLTITPFNLNKWVRLFSTTNPSRIVLEIDINTQQEIHLEITNDLVEHFFGLSNQLTLDTISAHS
jgi:hypothetical protein